MAITQDAATMELIRSRLANDERPLKRVLKAFYRLAEPSSTDILASPMDDDFVDRMQRQQAEFLLELRNLARQLETTKGTRIATMTQREVEGLKEEKRKVEEQTEEQGRRIGMLEVELEKARQERKERMQYEEVGREVRRYGDRVQSAERMAGLSKEIDALLQEQESYSQRWASRQAQFDTVVKNLVILQDSIREEKEDSDRKKALDDDEADDAASDSGAAGNPSTTEGATTTRAGSPTASPRPPHASLDPSAPAFRPSSGTRAGTPLTRGRGGRGQEGDREIEEAVMKGMGMMDDEGEAKRGSAVGTPAGADVEDTTMEDGEEREE